MIDVRAAATVAVLHPRGRHRHERIGLCDAGRRERRVLVVGMCVPIRSGKPSGPVGCWVPRRPLSWVYGCGAIGGGAGGRPLAEFVEKLPWPVGKL